MRGLALFLLLAVWVRPALAERWYADDANAIAVPGFAIVNVTLGAGEPVAFEPGLPRHLVVMVGLERRRMTR